MLGDELRRGFRMFFNGSFDAEKGVWEESAHTQEKIRCDPRSSSASDVVPAEVRVDEVKGFHQHDSGDFSIGETSRDQERGRKKEIHKYPQIRVHVK